MKQRERGSRREAGIHGKHILVIVTGGISAYKSTFLVRLLKHGGARVRVVMTDAATKFVTPLTFEVLSGSHVPVDMFAPRDEPAVEHVELASWADRVVVAPATADFLAKSANGLADDLPSTVLLAVRCPVYFAPAMNTGMWENPSVLRNIATLKTDGKKFIEPGTGDLACGDVGPGRMAEPEDIFRVLTGSFERGDLDGVRVLVTAGRTEEHIDPVRYLSNRSSGRMGFAIAAGAKERGARVELVHGPVDVATPEVDSVTTVISAAQMKRAVLRAFPRCDILVMAAAVADFSPAKQKGKKLKRDTESLTIELVPTDDILAAVGGKKKAGQIVVGFALETDDAERNAVRKGREKGCDYIVLNRVGKDTGFGVSTNQVTMFKSGRRLFTTPVISKEEAASLILERLSKDKRLK
jgi:phosphopantothenoylcysteine decarboxylase/phosphopantothenate--cysteine ligase